MEHFFYKENNLVAEGVPIATVAEQYGTPCFIYSRAALEHGYGAYREAFDDHSHLICYAVKANSNIAVLNVLAKLGAGFDIVSGGELARVIAAGGDPKKVTFSGLGKTTDEIRYSYKNSQDSEKVILMSLYVLTLLNISLIQKNS